MRDHGRDKDRKDAARQKEESDIFDEQETEKETDTNKSWGSTGLAASRLVRKIIEVPVRDADKCPRHASYSKDFCLCVRHTKINI